MHLWTRDRHLCDGLSQRHRWTCARHLCGNKISDAPRHRRDLVSVTGSFHTVRHGIVLDESKLIIVVQLQLCAVARHAAKLPVQQAQMCTGAEHRSGWPDRHVQTWSARCAGASRVTAWAGVGSCSGNTTRIADAIAPSCWPLIEPRPQFLLRTRRFFFDGSRTPPSSSTILCTSSAFLPPTRRLRRRQIAFSSSTDREAKGTASSSESSSSSDSSSDDGASRLIVGFGGAGAGAGAHVGRGASATVYRAYDRERDRWVALKLGEEGVEALRREFHGLAERIRDAHITPLQSLSLPTGRR